MKRLAIVTAFAIACLAGARPHTAHAAILPDCDRTVYYVQDENKLPNVCSSVYTSACKTGAGMTPDEYEAMATANGGASWKQTHPPIIATNRQCGFNDFVQLFINLAAYGLGVLGVLGVAVIIWGGFDFLLAMGSQEKIKEAKQTIWGGVLGTFIVLIAFVMVNWVVSMLTGTGPVLFAGKSNPEYFYGTKCPNYKVCSKNNLYYTPKTDSKGTVTSVKACKDGKANGNAVTTLQGLLSDLGCYTGSVDGCFGPETQKALSSFQQRNISLAQPENQGQISSEDDWTALENAKNNAGGFVGCNTVPMTKAIDISVVNGGLVFSDQTTVSQFGTVTWTNKGNGDAVSGPDMTVTFSDFIDVNQTMKPVLTIPYRQAKSVTFPLGGSFHYTLSINYSPRPQDAITATGTVNVYKTADMIPGY